MQKRSTRVEPRRAFGTVLQPNARAQPASGDSEVGPSPLKKIRISAPNDENRAVQRTWRADKKNAQNSKPMTKLDQLRQTCDQTRRQPTRSTHLDETPPSPPSAPTCSSSPSTIPQDLNSSFTEKISNLAINQRPANNRAPLEPIHTNYQVEDPYTPEIVAYWHKLESRNRMPSNYMNGQREISYKMRTILVDWLVEVGVEYAMHNATVHRSVHFVDRFLSRLQISRSNLQLLGTTCLFIASKIEEINPPDTTELVYITDNTYDKPQMLKMECLALSVLDFDLLTPTAHDFTNYYAHLLDFQEPALTYAHYASELTLLHAETFLGYKPSVIALAACYTSTKCCGTQHLNAYAPHQPTKSTETKALKQFIQVLRPPTPELLREVEQAVAHLLVTILSVSSPSQTSEPNSITTKYRQFQDPRYMLAAASVAACLQIPWHNNLLP